MGIYVHLAVVTDRVSDVAWRGIYDKARRVAKQWTPRPLSSSWRQIGGVRVAQYTSEIETAEGLHLVGDAETLTTAESFVLPAKLDRAALRRDREDPPATPDGDVLAEVARWLASDTEQVVSWRDLFGAKTQGLPYHVLTVALGLVVEHSLPGTAVVYGDISVSDGEQARRGAASILGEELKLPVVVDAERLRRRLARSLNANALDQAICQLGLLDPHLEAITGALPGVLRRFPEECVSDELEHVVLSCSDPDHLSTETREVLHRLVEAIRSSVVLWELRERVEQWGAAGTREQLARRTLASGMRLTAKAWDAIEVADLDELAFLVGAACMDTTGLVVHRAVRAVLENRTLRQA